MTWINARVRAGSTDLLAQRTQPTAWNAHGHLRYVNVDEPYGPYQSKRKWSSIARKRAADDYITEPFGPEELTTRTGVVLRRARPVAASVDLRST